ncbi:ABC-type transporter, integral membrane subunit [halophilic archaeon DL31]|jgi:peptide/nickel transport system permease protein|nr:ABC-type transporter, integral membrane subunit [halophilic archaeon DL31]
MGLKRYIAKRTVHAMFVMWLVATTVFFGLRAIPGGPIQAMLGAEATPEAVERLREQLGLNRPIWVQYGDWMTDLLVLNLGRSINTGEPVADVLLTTAPRTFAIGGLGIVVGLLISIPAGIIAATRRRETIDYVSTMAAFLGISMPAFFIGILLALVFGVWFNLLPIVGYTPLSEGVIPWFKSILLPGIAVGLPYGAIVMRMMRSSLLEVMNEPYMRTALAKGVDSRVRLVKHALQNAMIPVITVAGIQVAIIIVGSVTVELVFGIKGLGRVLVNSMLDRDYAVTQGAILLVAFILVFMNLAVDLTYTVIDPRIRYGDENQ